MTSLIAIRDLRAGYGDAVVLPNLSLDLAAGQVLLQGTDLAILTAPELRQRRRTMQLVFQDPLSPLDPMQRVGQIVVEPLRALPEVPDRSECERRVAAQFFGARGVRHHRDAGFRRVQVGGAHAQQVVQRDREHPRAEIAPGGDVASEQRLVEVLLGLAGR